MDKIFRNKIDQVQLILISLVWLLLFASPLLFGESDGGIVWNHVLSIWKEYGLLFLLFLINRFVLMPFLFFKEKRTLYFTSIVGLIILLSVFINFAHNKRPVNNPPQRTEMHRPPPHLPPGPMHHPPAMQAQKEFIPPYAIMLILSVLLIGFDSGLSFFSKWMQSEQNKIKAEKESIKNKMAFLQTQISPHFFMNTLNNIHALVDINTDEAKTSIVKLSQLMSYMLYESQTAKVPLQKEMEFIKSYVDLMRLRFTDDVEVKLDVPTIIPPVKVPPLLTISFIENAFKYGVSYERDSFIHIRFELTDDRLKFKIINSVNGKKGDAKHSGIGIENSRDRLKLIYGDNYNLSIKDDVKDTFEVNLNVPI